jgi:hypothetical protein
VSDLIATTVIPIGHLQSIELDTEFGCETIQEGLGLGIGIETGPLRTTTRLKAIHVITVFVVYIDAIEILLVNNVHEARGKLFLFSKAVIPAVIVISVPASTHSSASKRENDLLPHPAPFVNECLVVGIVADRNGCANVALRITLVLGSIPGVRNGECNYQVRVGINLCISRA